MERDHFPDVLATAYKAYSDVIMMLRRFQAEAQLTNREYEILVGHDADLYREFCSLEQGHAGVLSPRFLQAAQAIARKTLILHPEWADSFQAFSGEMRCR